MSNDVRRLLHDAATTPSADADVAGAWRRGRRLTARRRAAGALAIAAVVGLGSVAVANVVPNRHHTSPAAPVTTVGLECYAVSTATDDVPSWAESAHPPASVPHVLSPDGNVVAFLFGDPLAAGSPTGKQNKILWIVRQPRQGRPLQLTITLPQSDVSPLLAVLPANSSPGEIYPSTVNVPVPGCWHFALAWNGHHSAINLGYGSVVPKEPTVTTTTTKVSVATTICRTANLTLTLGPPIGSAGHMNYEIAFRNHSGATCVMSGYPGVSFLDASGTQTGVPAQRNPIPHTPVTLAPGATAYAHLAVNDLGMPPCSAPARRIRVYPPNETTPALITVAAMAMCGSSTIDPVLDHSLG
jgi:Protein of unknown function (DUF4232)